MEKTNNFGDEMYNSRISKKLSQETVAELCGLSARQCHNIEVGEADPKLSTAIKITKALDISLDALIK